MYLPPLLWCHNFSTARSFLVWVVSIYISMSWALQRSRLYSFSSTFVGNTGIEAIQKVSGNAGTCTCLHSWFHNFSTALSFLVSIDSIHISRSLAFKLNCLCSFSSFFGGDTVIEAIQKVSAGNAGTCTCLHSHVPASTLDVITFHPLSDFLFPLTLFISPCLGLSSAVVCVHFRHFSEEIRGPKRYKR